MRIESKVGVVPVADSRDGKPAATAAQHHEQGTAASVVHLSAGGAAVHAADTDELNPMNRTRIAEIREAIKHDKYPIDLDKLASKIVADDVVRGSKGDRTS